ncbi:glycoside hydrolase family 3 N-terminal domain-containing protein [Catenulispora yoronensis]|uniref:Glycoside hydrolase family 3 N-terminal domain-containing protein n=1 Tax=Catenulispora yoronensis TaxID=450799 RepID=A0ABN2UB15_9ACTN
MTAVDISIGGVWRDPQAPVAERIRDLMARMTVEEKAAQLYALWVGIDSAEGTVAPFQHELAGLPAEWETLIATGVGQLTRVYGTAPVDPVEGARGLAAVQRQIMAAGRFGIPAQVHEECLTGLAAWRASAFPSPLCWGASFDPDLVRELGARIGATMRRLGAHQGLAPVLDVARDPRWGRTEETIGEDPYLVGTIGSAYVAGLESAGVVATLKHFAGYSASRAGRNMAPVSMGPRELADVILPPFEMALRAGARSVMNAYTDTDGVPAADDPALLTDLLRGRLGFGGTVVADYFSISFLETQHGVAADAGQAAGKALTAGIDVELPSAACYRAPLIEAVRSGAVDVALVDRALERVLRQKFELGLLDPGWSPEAPILRESAPELDDVSARELAGRLARRSIVLLANDGTLPLAPGRRIAVIGPRADDPGAMLGCYSFPRHVGVNHPDLPMGVEIPTLLEALADFDVRYQQGCPVLGGDDEGIEAAVRAAAEADVAVVALGDEAGLFGAGTSGEGCDAADLRLPGRQEELLEAVLGTGTPVVLVLLVGRPYELSRQIDRLAAVVCGFFPGEEGGSALADVLSGKANPAGRLPVSFPAAGASQPSTYLAPPLGARNQSSSVDPTALFPFGHGLSYAAATWGEAEAAGELAGGLAGESAGEWPTDGVCRLTVPLRNDTDRATSEVVQVYLHDPVAEVVRPVRRLIAASRVDLEPGESRTVRLALHADLTSFTGRSMTRLVEPGHVELHVGASSTDIRAKLPVTLTGARREVGADRVLSAEVEADQQVPREHLAG